MRFLRHLVPASGCTAGGLQAAEPAAGVSGGGPRPARAEPRLPCDEAFKSAVAVWYMDGSKDACGRHELKTVGAVTLGARLEGNTEPCLIGAESYGSRIASGWKGLSDHVALWNRALTDAEIERLSGGAARVAALKAAYRKLGGKSPLEIHVQGGEVRFSRLEFHPLRSIHPPP